MTLQLSFSPIFRFVEFTLNFMCSPTARTWGGVRTNIYKIWVLNNPHAYIAKFN